VIRGYFFEQRLMGDLAGELGVSESRVSQLRTEALSLLRHGMAAQYRDPSTLDSPGTGRSAARLASYAAAIASRGSLHARLSNASTLGEQITSYAQA
jgi:RNA polymerase sigma factor for flagellar operon FliA